MKTKQPLTFEEIMTEIEFTYKDLADPSLHGLARKILSSEGNTCPTDEQVKEMVSWYIQWKCHQDEPPAKKKVVKAQVSSKPVRNEALDKVLADLKTLCMDLESYLKVVQHV
jgi:hypothetical protein